MGASSPAPGNLSQVAHLRVLCKKPKDLRTQREREGEEEPTTTNTMRAARKRDKHNLVSWWNRKTSKGAVVTKQWGSAARTDEAHLGETHMVWVWVCWCDLPPSQNLEHPHHQLDLCFADKRQLFPWSVSATHTKVGHDKKKKKIKSLPPNHSRKKEYVPGLLGKVPSGI